MIGLLSSISAVGLMRWLQRRSPARLAVAATGLAGLASIFWVFRNPRRHVAPALHTVLAPCDGNIEAITLVQEGRFLRSPAHRLRIRVQMSDVQIV